jgi:hypothetical protein
MTNSAADFLKKTHLVEEVPGVPTDEQYYLWHNRGVVWRGPSKEDGEEWAVTNRIVIEQFEPFEP